VEPANRLDSRHHQRPRTHQSLSRNHSQPTKESGCKIEASSATNSLMATTTLRWPVKGQRSERIECPGGLFRPGQLQPRPSQRCVASRGASHLDHHMRRAIILRMPSDQGKQGGAEGSRTDLNDGSSLCVLALAYALTCMNDWRRLHRRATRNGYLQGRHHMKHHMGLDVLSSL